jgi:hypothetical protein
MIHRAIGITSVLAALASSTVASAPESPAIEDFYCEASYINFAHGYQHKGHYVDGRGRVFRFDTVLAGCARRTLAACGVGFAHTARAGGQVPP